MNTVCTYKLLMAVIHLVLQPWSSKLLFWRLILHFNLFKAKGWLILLEELIIFIWFVYWLVSQLVSKPSNFSNMLWSAQHVSQISSQFLIFPSLIPFLKMENFCLRIPNTHSISFLMLSSHSLQHLTFYSQSPYLDQLQVWQIHAAISCIGVWAFNKWCHLLMCCYDYQ